MKIWSRQNLSGAGILVTAIMTGNFLNFLTSAFLGRVLTYEQFGLLTFYNTILFLSGIFFGALANSVNHRTAYLNGKYSHEAGISFTRFVRNRSYLVGALFMGLWLALTPLVGQSFHIEELWSLVFFSPIFVFGLIAVVNRGFLQGNLHFRSVAILILVESLAKLLSAAALVFLKLDDLVYLSVPFSLFAAFGLSIFLTRKRIPTETVQNHFRFPKRFMAAASITGLSAAAFLSIDVILAKHYLPPDQAGQYALLSLVGKMVYLMGSLLNGLMITFVSRDVGRQKNPARVFHLIFAACVTLTALGVVLFGVLGDRTVPLLLGERVLPILGYLQTYALAIGLFTISSMIVIYHLALEEYTFSFAALGIAAAMSLGIIVRHENIGEITQVILYSSIGSLSVMALLHVLARRGRFMLANLIDLFNVFTPLEKQATAGPGGKRILIMNWRDIKHSMAGGAEVYVHELAKRWVASGHQVTLFCGNDGKSPLNETIDGVRIVRRGGFYFVYFWAFIYYFTKFRGKFEMILDCHNGIPFFTPLYAKEKFIL